MFRKFLYITKIFIMSFKFEILLKTNYNWLIKYIELDRYYFK